MPEQSAQLESPVLGSDTARARAELLARLARGYAASGAAPATAGNYSVRLDGGELLITPSGLDKSRAQPDDLLRLTLDGEVLGGGRPSAETGLHLGLYRRDPSIGAVLHTHFMDALVLVRDRPALTCVRFEHHEMLKVFAGYDTHLAAMSVPIIENDQDIDALAAVADDALDRVAPDRVAPDRVAPGGGSGPVWGYLIRDHGLYAWGPTLEDTARHMEAFEYLFAFELRVALRGP